MQDQELSTFAEVKKDHMETADQIISGIMREHFDYNFDSSVEALSYMLTACFDKVDAIQGPDGIIQYCKKLIEETEARKNPIILH